MKVLVLISLFSAFFLQAQDNYCLVEKGASGKGSSTHYEAYCRNGEQFSVKKFIFLSALSKKKLQRKYNELFNELMDEASKYNLEVIASLKSDYDHQGYRHILLSDNQKDDMDYCYSTSWNMSKRSKDDKDRHTLYCDEKVILQTSDLTVLKEYITFKGYAEAASLVLDNEYRSLHVFEKSSH